MFNSPEMENTEDAMENSRERKRTSFTEIYLGNRRREITPRLILLLLSEFLSILLFSLTLSAGISHGFRARVLSGPSMLGGFPVNIGKSRYLQWTMVISTVMILYVTYLLFRREKSSGKKAGATEERGGSEPSTENYYMTNFCCCDFLCGGVLWVCVFSSWLLVAVFELYYKAGIYSVVRVEKVLVSKVNICGFYAIQQASNPGLRMSDALRKACGTVTLEQAIVATSFCLLVLWSAVLLRRTFKVWHLTHNPNGNSKKTTKTKFRLELLQLSMAIVFAICSIITLRLAPCFPNCTFGRDTEISMYTSCATYTLVANAIVVVLCICWAVHLHWTNISQSHKYHSTIQATVAVLMTCLSTLAWVWMVIWLEQNSEFRYGDGADEVGLFKSHQLCGFKTTNSIFANIPIDPRCEGLRFIQVAMVLTFFDSTFLFLLSLLAIRRAHIRRSGTHKRQVREEEREQGMVVQASSTSATENALSLSARRTSALI